MKYDVAIIGGGPAGMIAAISAAENGAKVILLEKNDRLGVKLLLTGHGRCNLTNKTPDLNSFINALGINGRFLFSAMTKFGVEKTMDFFSKHDLPLKTEENNKIFPKSDDGRDVLTVLVNCLKKNKVEVRLKSTVKKINVKNKVIESITLDDKEKISANNFILCAGGKSYPLTGSTGDGFTFAEQAGHTIVSLFPGLTPFILNDSKIKFIEGVSLKNVLLKATLNKKLIAKQQGDIIFTANGVSGPAVITLSQKIAPQVNSKLTLTLDLLPEINTEEIDKYLISLLAAAPNKTLQSILNELLPQRFVKYFAEKNKIDLDQKCNAITAQERRTLGERIKNLDYRIKNLEGFEKAMITVGGVNLKEVDPKTMKSKIIKNLYFAGEVLDLSGPTGGYNLQICWSTGFVAGVSATTQ